MEQKSIIIIGAGIAGLSAGCYGQMNGYRTQIFEMHNKPGGVFGISDFFRIFENGHFPQCFHVFPISTFKLKLKGTALSLSYSLAQECKYGCAKHGEPRQDYKRVFGPDQHPPQFPL
jgi:phytoene dehydrogenase-like protein